MPTEQDISWKGTSSYRTFTIKFFIMRFLIRCPASSRRKATQNHHNEDTVILLESMILFIEGRCLKNDILVAVSRLTYWHLPSLTSSPHYFFCSAEPEMIHSLRMASNLPGSLCVVDLETQATVLVFNFAITHCRNTTIPTFSKISPSVSITHCLGYAFCYKVCCRFALPRPLRQMRVSNSSNQQHPQNALQHRTVDN